MDVLISKLKKVTLTHLMRKRVVDCSRWRARNAEEAINLEIPRKKGEYELAQP